jgi:hypothetical protein
MRARNVRGVNDVLHCFVPSNGLSTISQSRLRIETYWLERGQKQKARATLRKLLDGRLFSTLEWSGKSETLCYWALAAESIENSSTAP